MRTLNLHGVPRRVNQRVPGDLIRVVQQLLLWEQYRIPKTKLRPHIKYPI